MDHSSSIDLEGDAMDTASETVITEKPPLLKLFTEERRGSDVDGLAFFEKLVLENGSSEMEKLQPVEHMKNISNDPATMQTISVTAKLKENEHVELWIPSVKTQEMLSTHVVSEEFQTKPMLIIEEEFEDSLKLLLMQVKSLVAHERKVLTANDVPQDCGGLQALIDAGAYHSAVNLSTRLLKLSATITENNVVTEVTHQSLLLWYNRIALFVKMKKFSFAEVESEAFGNLDNPDLYHEYYTSSADKQSSVNDEQKMLKEDVSGPTCIKRTLVPFSFRLLLAELPQYQGNYQLTSNSLYQILHVIEKLIEDHLRKSDEMKDSDSLCDDEFLKLWRHRESRVLFSILNCALSQKDYMMAVSVANGLLKKNEGHSSEIYSIIGRINLQLGDLRQAENYFQLAAASKSSTSKELDVKKFINLALLSVSRNNNEEAYNFYKQALALDPNNIMITNNMAVCLLYLGKLRESVTLLEQTIHKNPQLCIQNGVIFNICTLYELESSHSTAKKYAMLDLISKYANDKFSATSLKI